MGIQQVVEGDFELAVITLDGVVDDLAAQPTHKKELVRAYLYLGVAYVGLGQRQKAQAQFLEAWRLDGSRSLSGHDFPPAIVGLYEETRRQAEEAARKESAAPPAPAGTTASSPQVKRDEPPKKGGGAKWLLIGGGVAAAVGGGIALSGKGGDSGGPSSPSPPPGPSPVVEATFTPDRVAIASVTQVTFSAVVTHLTSPSFSWVFDDGSTGTGRTPTHVYESAGVFRPTVTANGPEGTDDFTLQIEVRDVEGLWQEVAAAGYLSEMDLRQSRQTVTGQWRVNQLVGGEWSLVEDVPLAGDLTDPDAVEFWSEDRCRKHFVGRFDDDVTQMHVQVTHTTGPCDQSLVMDRTYVRR